MEDRGTYEERFGAVRRRFHRGMRAVKWRVKGALGIRRRILVEIRWRLGDEIMALPIYDTLKQQHVDADLSVWCTYPELLAGNANVGCVNTDVDPDRYILLRHAARDMRRLEHYARLAGVPVPHEGPRISVPASTEDDWTRPPRVRVVIAPGASWSTKRWPRERWEDLGDRLVQIGCDVAVLGSAGEGLGTGRDLTGQTTITDCARILGGADVCVCSDSGLMHLALAAGTMVVALFGPTNPGILVQGEPRLRVVSNGRECRYCWNGSQEMTEPGVCPRRIEWCLGTIDVDTVVKVLRDLTIIDEKSPHP